MAHQHRLYALLGYCQINSKLSANLTRCASVKCASKLSFSTAPNQAKVPVQKKIEKLLIANRGEIACRIMRTAKR